MTGGSASFQTTQRLQPASVGSGPTVCIVRDASSAVVSSQVMSARVDEHLLACFLLAAGVYDQRRPWFFLFGQNEITWCKVGGWVAVDSKVGLFQKELCSGKHGGRHHLKTEIHKNPLPPFGSASNQQPKGQAWSDTKDRAELDERKDHEAQGTLLAFRPRWEQQKEVTLTATSTETDLVQLAVLKAVLFGNERSGRNQEQTQQCFLSSALQGEFESTMRVG